MSKATKSAKKEPSRPVAMIVLGMHRSGTSATGGVLNLLGCDAPATLMPAHPTNPKGFFESQVLFELNTDILASANSAWDDWKPIDKGWFRSAEAREGAEKVKAALISEFADSRLFVLKDPRLCRLLPLYRGVLDDMGTRTAIVHVHRNPVDVAASLHERDKLHPDYGPLIWLRHILDAERNSRDLRRGFMSYDQLLQSWEGSMDRLGKELKVTWPRRSSTSAAEIEAFLSPTLRHHETPSEGVLKDPQASAWIKGCYDILQKWAQKGESAKDHATLDQINRAFSESVAAYGRLIGTGRATAGAGPLGAQGDKRGADRAALQDQVALIDRDRQALEASLEQERAAAQEKLDEIAQLRSALAQRQHEAQDWAERAKAAETERATRQTAFAATEDRLNRELAVLTKDLLKIEADYKNLQDAHATASANHALEIAQLMSNTARSADAPEKEARHLRELALLTQEVVKAEATIDRMIKDQSLEEARHAAAAAEKTAELARIRERLDAGHQALTTVAQRAEALEAEKTALTGAVSRAAEVLAQERERGAAVRKTLQDLVGDLTGQVDSQKTALAQARSTEDALRNELAQRAAQAADQARHLAEVDHVRKALLSSTSWRITAPIRALAHLLRGKR